MQRSKELRGRRIRRKDRSSLQTVSDAPIPRRRHAVLVLWLTMFDSHSVVSHSDRGWLCSGGLTVPHTQSMCLLRSFCFRGHILVAE